MKNDTKISLLYFLASIMIFTVATFIFRDIYHRIENHTINILIHRHTFGSALTALFFMVTSGLLALISLIVLAQTEDAFYIIPFYISALIFGLNVMFTSYIIPIWYYNITFIHINPADSTMWSMAVHFLFVGAVLYYLRDSDIHSKIVA